jgi:hypothetical protein
MSPSAKSVGRILGGLLVVQGVLGYTCNFVLLAPAIAPPGFLVNAAAHALEVNVAALLLFASGVIWLGMALTALPLFRAHSQTLAMWFVAFAIVNLAGLAAEGIGLRSMLALSQEFAKAGASDPAAFQPMVALVRSLRNSAHFTNFLSSGGALIVFYSLLFRSNLIPRALSALGLATVVLMISGALIPLLGFPTVMLMFMPMGVSHLATAAWLVAKGLEERQHPLRNEEWQRSGA